MGPGPAHLEPTGLLAPRGSLQLTGPGPHCPGHLIAPAVMPSTKSRFSTM